MAKQPLPPVDPDVKIPEAVRRAAAASDAMIRAQGGETPSDPPAEPDQPAPTQPPQEAPQPPVPPYVTPEPQQPPPPPPSQPPPRAADSAEDENSESWKRRYDAMQGRVVAGARIISELNERINNMEMLLATVQAPPSEPKVAPRYVTDDDLETYGEDFINMVDRVASEKIEAVRQEYEDKFGRLEGQVNGFSKVVTQDAKDKMRNYLTNNISDWRKINVAPEFKDEWLMQPDDLTGQIRKDMLLSAWERNDAPRVAAFFRTFLREQAIENGEPLEQPQPAPVRAPAVKLGAFAAPGRVKQAQAPNAQPNRQPITRNFIKSFYADVTAGRITPERKAEIERDIWAAQSTGLIQP